MAENRPVKSSFLYTWGYDKTPEWWEEIRVKAVREKKSINKLITELLDTWLESKKEG